MKSRMMEFSPQELNVTLFLSLSYYFYYRLWHWPWREIRGGLFKLPEAFYLPRPSASTVLYMPVRQSIKNSTRFIPTVHRCGYLIRRRRGWPPLRQLAAMGKFMWALMISTSTPSIRTEPWTGAFEPADMSIPPLPSDLMAPSMWVPEAMERNSSYVDFHRRHAEVVV